MTLHKVVYIYLLKSVKGLVGLDIGRGRLGIDIIVKEEYAHVKTFNTTPICPSSALFYEVYR